MDFFPPLSSVLACWCSCLLLLSCCSLKPAAAEEVDVWIGTTTPENGASRGIYHATFVTDKGRLTTPRLAAEVSKPGFLALHPNGQVLYATARLDDQDSVASFRIARHDGHASLTLLNAQPTGDGGAAHLATDRSGQVLLSAQYSGGSTAIYPLAADGSIQPRTQLLKHQGGSGVVAGRQDAPHAHWIGTSPDNRFVFVPDLGLDQVVIYQLDAERATLSPHGSGKVPAGSGPRHMKFHPNGKFIYVLNELELSVTCFAYDTEQGTMAPLQTIPTVSAHDKEKEKFVSASEIRVHPSGKYVYAANRGHDTITAFRVDPASGQLALIECEPVRGSWPRNFNLDPTGKWLIAAGRDSHTLAVFAIDAKSGELTYTLHTVSVPTPICVLLGR